MQTSTKLSLAAALTTGLILSGCGGAGTSGAAGTASTVSGVATADVQLTSVALRDSSSPAQSTSATPSQDGTYSIDVASMTPPFVLKAEDAGRTTALYAIAPRPGTTDINELSTVAAAAAGHGQHAGDAWDDDGERHDAGVNIERVIQSLQTVLKPLFDLYQVNLGGEDPEESAAMRALLNDVSFTAQSGNLVVTNRQTGAVIYSAPLKALTTGTFHPENMPPGPSGTPGTTCSSFTYSAWSPAVCDASGMQTRTVLTSSPSGCTGGAPVLSQTCTPPSAGTCTSFTYSAWSPAVCDASGMQTRTVLTSSPSGCTGGAPVLSQTCTPPSAGTCTSFTYSAWSPAVCDATGKQTRTVLTSSPSGCTGGAPVLSQTCTPPAVTCTSFTYSAWSPAVCDATGKQTRTVLTSSPSGCTGGAPVLSQTCTPPAVTCTSFTYSAWSPAVCDATGKQTRTVLTSSPSGCTGGAPVLSQTCTPPLDGAALYTQSCSSCHGSLATSNLKGKNISVSLIKSFGMTQGLSDAQLQAIVTAVGP